MDPLGFALENFDPLGRWRSVEAGKPVDASGALPDGTRLNGPAGLQRFLARPARAVRHHPHREAVDVRARTEAGFLRRPGRARGQAGGGRPRLPLVIDRARHRQEHALSDEEHQGHDVHRQTGRSASNRASRAWARAWPCRSWTRWSRHLPRNAPRRPVRFAASAWSTCRTGWRCSGGRRCRRARASSPRGSPSRRRSRRWSRFAISWS